VPVDHLNLIRRARKKKDNADDALRAAVLDAINDGVPLRQAAAAAGVSRQAVYNWTRINQRQGNS